VIAFYDGQHQANQINDSNHGSLNEMIARHIPQCTGNRRGRNSSEPPAIKPRSPQTARDVGALPHQLPHHPRALILDHQDNGALI